jgi:hypothetical protein
VKKTAHVQSDELGMELLDGTSASCWRYRAPAAIASPAWKQAESNHAAGAHGSEQPILSGHPHFRKSCIGTDVLFSFYQQKNAKGGPESKSRACGRVKSSIYSFGLQKKKIYLLTTLSIRKTYSHFYLKKHIHISFDILRKQIRLLGAISNY